MFSPVPWLHPLCMHQKAKPDISAWDFVHYDAHARLKICHFSTVVTAKSEWARPTCRIDTLVKPRNTPEGRYIKPLRSTGSKQASPLEMPWSPCVLLLVVLLHLWRGMLTSVMKIGFARRSFSLPSSQIAICLTVHRHCGQRQCTPNSPPLFGAYVQVESWNEASIILIICLSDHTTWFDVHQYYNNISFFRSQRPRTKPKPHILELMVNVHDYVSQFY